MHRVNWKWLLLVLVALVVVSLSGQAWRIGHWLPSSSPHQADIGVSHRAPRVDSEQLLSDVAALSFVRSQAEGRDRARRYIMQSLTQSGWTVQRQPFTAAGKTGENLVAIRPGRDATAGIVLLGAHYDTVGRSPGADDNATAVATLLETARLLGSEATSHPLHLVLFDLEEAGLLGSTAFVEAIPNPRAYDGAMILDMLGYRCTVPGCQTYPSLPIAPPSDQGDFLAVIVDQGHAALLSAVQAQPTGVPVFTLAIPPFSNLMPDAMRSDHAPFWNRGIGALLVTDTANFRNPHYHQATDTPETLDSAFLASAAQVVVDAIATLTHTPSQ
ncbi:MAG: M28 family peptidase [Kaiparowitsia implicata GSE-PSE-MK54-09C]|jgi:hypothetical protein|nr:M28 family peptidase [Kaiparowitsia implicata GSE-PSE-MK54-09C]